LVPSLSASGGWTHNQYEAVVSLPNGDGTTRTITIVPKNQLEATLRAELPLIDVAKWAQVAASSASLEAARLRERATRAQVHRQVVSAFYAHVAARQALESAKRSLAVAEADVEVRRSRTAAGVGTELELMRGVAEVERNQQALAAAEALVATTARTLETASGLAPSKVDAALLTVSTGEAPPELASLEDAVASLPVVAASEADARAASRTQLAATLALVPSVSVQFTERLTNATGFQNAPAQASGGLTFNWRLDLVGVSALRAQSAAAELAWLDAERDRRAAADRLHADWHALKAALKKAQSASSQVAAARRASELSHERNQAGVATQLDVIQAERDLFAAELAQVQANAELATARVHLALSSGKAATP
jgi:outer membrane protein TolC